MSLQLLYWHWLIIGMLLILAEIFIPSFTIFWFGLAAILVSGFVWLFPSLVFNWQLLIWVLASCLFTLLWLLYVRPLMRDRTKAGISREAVLGEKGVVVQVPEGGRRGIVRFTIPVLGDDEWAFICEESVKKGDRVTVIDVSGNTLIVQKHP